MLVEYDKIDEDLNIPSSGCELTISIICYRRDNLLHVPCLVRPTLMPVSTEDDWREKSVCDLFENF